MLAAIFVQLAKSRTAIVRDVLFWFFIFQQSDGNPLLSKDQALFFHLAKEVAVHHYAW